MAESDYQKHLINKLKKMFPGCVVIKQDANYIQGIPDLCIFYNDTYAFLEVKKNVNSKIRPNQPYYVDLFNKMSFASFIYPENEKEVLNDLQQAFESRRTTRLSRSQ